MPFGEQTLTKDGNRFTIEIDNSGYKHHLMRIKWKIVDQKGEVVSSGISPQNQMAWPVAEALADQYELYMHTVEKLEGERLEAMRIRHEAQVA